MKAINEVGELRSDEGRKRQTRCGSQSGCPEPSFDSLHGQSGDSWNKDSLYSSESGSHIAKKVSGEFPGVDG